jgi:hypothetical protein
MSYTYPENPFVDKEELDKLKKRQARFDSLREKITSETAELAIKNASIANFTTPTLGATAALTGLDFENIDPRTLERFAQNIVEEQAGPWNAFKRGFKGALRGSFLAFDAGLDFVDQVLGRFPVAIGQRFNDKKSQGMSSTQALTETFQEFPEIRQQVGDTAFTLALREIKEGRPVNVGKGIIPSSQNIVDTPEYQKLTSMGVQPEQALQLAEQIVGKPITTIAEEKAKTGVQFRGETGAKFKKNQEDAFVTPGRLLAEPLAAAGILEPGSKTYSWMTGITDAALTVALDPAFRGVTAVGGAMKAKNMAKYITAADRAEYLAELQKAGGIANNVRRTIIAKAPARTGNNSIEEVLKTEPYRELTKMISSSNKIEDAGGNPDVLMDLLKIYDQPDLINDLTKLTDEGLVYEKLLDVLSKGYINTSRSIKHARELPISTPRLRSFMKKKIIGNFDAPIGQADELIKAGGFAPIMQMKLPYATRLMENLHKPQLTLNNSGKAIANLQLMMKQMGLDTVQRGKFIAKALEIEYGLGAVDDVVKKIAGELPPGKIVPKTADERGVALALNPRKELENLLTRTDITPEQTNTILEAYFGVADDVALAQLIDDLPALRKVGWVMRSKELALRENAELATIAKEVDLTQTLQKNKLDMYFKLITEIGDTWKGNLAKEFDDGLNDEVLEYVGQVFKEEFEGFRRYGITTDGNRLDYGPALAALVDGSKTKIPAYRLSTEMIQNSIPLYDPRDVIKVTSKVQRKLLKNKSLDEFKSKTKVEGFNLYLDKYISKVWKPLVLIRAAWTVRVIAEEQIRMAAAGYDTFVNPKSWIAYMTGKSSKGEANLLLEKFPELNKEFRNFAKGKMTIEQEQAFLKKVEKLDGAIESKIGETETLKETFFDALSGVHNGIPGLSRSNPALASLYVNVPKGQPKFYVKSLQFNLNKITGDDIAIKAIKEGPEAFKKRFWAERIGADGKPNANSDLVKFINRFPESEWSNAFNNRALADDIVDLAYARAVQVAGGTVEGSNRVLTNITLNAKTQEILDAIADGKFVNKVGKEISLTGGTRDEQLENIRKFYNQYKDELPNNLNGGVRIENLDKTYKDPIEVNQLVNSLYFYFMSMPTNKLSRAPVFKEAYWNKVTDLIAVGDDAIKQKIIAQAEKANVGEKYLAKMRKAQPSKNRALYTADDGVDDVFQIIDDLAKADALSRTKELLYDLGSSTRLINALRFAFPFGEAYKEIVTTWTRLLKSNPAPARRLEQIVVSGRKDNPFLPAGTDSGFFFEDPTTGEEMFAFPGWNGVLQNYMNMQSDDNVRVTSAGFASSLNIVSATLLPGFGPIVQIPAAAIIPNTPNYDFIRGFIFGDFEPARSEDESVDKIQNAFKSVFKAAVPSYAQKVLQAYEADVFDFQRVYGNTVIEVYKAMLYAGKIDDSTPGGMEKGLELAQDYAKGMTLIRSFAQFLGPTSFSPRFEVAVTTPEGRQFMFFSALVEEYRDYRDNVAEGNDLKTIEYFVNTYGINPIALTVPKTTSVRRTPVTVEGSKFFRDNTELFKSYKFTAYYSNPDDPTGEFDYASYLASLERKDRVPRTPEQWAIAKNQILGALAWEKFINTVDGFREAEAGEKPLYRNSSEQARLLKEQKRMDLKEQYPGWGNPLVGTPIKASRDQVIDEFYRWQNNEFLKNTEAGKGLMMYIEAREQAIQQGKDLGFTKTSFKTARSLSHLRWFLRDTADYIISEHPDFQYIWNAYFKQELLDEERDEIPRYNISGE